jgi:uncharacterized membrane protein
MFAATVALVTAIVVCLVFDTTRWIGVLGVALLGYLHPVFPIVLFLVAVVAAAVIHFYRRRSYRALPSPDSRGD